MPSETSHPWKTQNREATFPRGFLQDESASAPLERLVRLASRSLRSPVAFVALADSERPYVRAAYVHDGNRDDVRGAPVAESLCQPVLSEHRLIVIEDIARHSGQSYAVLDGVDLDARSALAVPIMLDDGPPIGMVCVADLLPREWSSDDIALLSELIDATLSEIAALANLQAVSAAQATTDALLESTAEGIYSIGQHGICTYINKAGAAMLGYTPREVIGRNVHSLVHHSRPGGSHYPEEQCEIWLAVSQGKTLIRSPQIFWHKDGSPIHVEVTASPNVEDGEFAGIAIAFTDVTERVQAEDALRASETRKSAMFDAALDCIITIGGDGRIIELNPAAERTFGYGGSNPNAPLEFKRLIKLTSGDRLSAALESWLESGELTIANQRIEVCAIRADGSEFPAEVTITTDVEATGDASLITAYLRDISDVKQREEEIRFFKHVVDAVGQAVMLITLDQTFSYWNRAAEELYGWKADEVLGRGVFDVPPADVAMDAANEIFDAISRGQTWSGEFHDRRRDGTEFPAYVTNAPILNDDGELLGTIVVVTDVSELKETEEQLRIFKRAIDAVDQAVMLVTPDRRIRHWNRAAETLYGWTLDEVAGQSIDDFPSSERSQAQWEASVAAIRAGRSWSGEFIDRRRDGSEFPVFATNSPIWDDKGNLLGAIVVARDISELKAAEEQLRFHKVMLDAVGQAVIATTPDGIVTDWNDAAEELYGWAASEAIGRPVLELTPSTDMEQRAEEIFAALRRGKTWSSEFRLKRRDGSEFTGFVTDAPIMDDHGTVIGIIGASADISQIKDAEEQLRLSKTLLDAVGQAIIATDSEARVIYWNHVAEDLYGLTAQDVVGRQFTDLYEHWHQVDHDQAIRALQEIASRGAFRGELTTYGPDGREIPMLVSASLLQSDEGELIGGIAALTDISERKQAEVALRESNQRVTRILESLTDGFVSVDRDWTTTYLNRQAENLLRAAREDVVGKNLWEVFPEATKLSFFDIYRSALETNEPVAFIEEYPPLGVWFEVHVYPSSDGLSIFFRDITERRLAEQQIRDAEERYRTLVEQMPAMTFTCDPQDVSRLIYVSPQVEDIVGYTPEEWLEDPSFWIERLHPDDRDRVLGQDAHSNHSGDSYSMEYRLVTRDGRIVWVLDAGQLIRDGDGNPLYWQGVSTDVTQAKIAEQQLRESEQRFRSLFDHHPDAVFSIDETGRVLTANPTWEQITGYTLESFKGWSFVRLVVPEDRDRVIKHFALARKGQPQTFDTAISNRRHNRIELSVTCIPIVVQDRIVGVHVVAQDVTLHQQLESQLAHQAYHDALTGLPNRSRFQSHLEQALTDIEGSGMRVGVLFLDLDDFKVINDSLGHSAGDSLLIEVAERIQTCIRAVDTLARFGGDEFTILLKSIRDDREAINIAERVSSALERTFDLGGHQVFVTTSIGIATASSPNISPDDILRNADLAMYEAKNAGKNRHVLFDPAMNARAWQRLTLESELRKALVDGEFVVHYQPIVDLDTGALHSVEALLRWQHPTRGLLTPDQFLDVAEQIGLILPIGRWVMSEASKHLRVWRDQPGAAHGLRLNLNLSARQFQHPNVISELTSVLTDTGLPPGAITLEITESVAMDDSISTSQTLRAMKRLGVGLALDDFGTGFSAFGYLRRFPIDGLKIDPSFVDGLGTENEDTSVVKAVIAAANAMHLAVTAEGIETEQQLRLLRAFDCRYGQGYLISPPLTADELAGALEKNEFTWLRNGPFAN